MKPPRPPSPLFRPPSASRKASGERQAVLERLTSGQLTTLRRAAFACMRQLLANSCQSAVRDHTRALASPTMFMAAGGASSCSSALRDSRSECSEMYFE